MSLIFYGHPESGHSYKVALALSMLEIPHEYRWVDVYAPRDQRAADFCAASPFGEIPILVVDGVPLAQSNAILLHLMRRTRRLGGETEARADQVQQCARDLPAASQGETTMSHSPAARGRARVRLLHPETPKLAATNPAQIR